MTDQEYIRHHKDDPVRPLALRPMPEGVNRTWVLQQIEGYQLAKKKLPHWAAIYDEGKDLHFPPRLSLEQCSSEATARYKAQELSIFNCQLSILIDLTGGFGVDFSYLAPHFSRAVYVEQQAVLCDVARHNLPLLGISNAEVINATCEEQLSTLNSPPSTSSPCKGELKEVFFFLDPARRDSAGNKVFCLEDCSPDITQLQDTLLNIGDAIMVKLSPMLDITQALRQLRCVTDVHVISVKGECKELLIIMRKDKASDQPITFHCVNLETEEEELDSPPTDSPPTDSPPAPLLERGEEYALSVSEKADKTFCNCSPLFKRGVRGESGGESLFLFEPNASILKAGLQDVFGELYGLSKLHPNSNLFVGKEPIPRVPARQFRIVDVTDFSKANLKRFLKGISHANLTIRNFPATVQELRKRLKLKEGGSDYLFATTLSDGSHVLIRCIKEQ